MEVIHGWGENGRFAGRDYGKPSVSVVPKDAVTITAYRDGPLLVRGAGAITGPDGTEIRCERDPVALCRCGRSRLKPFCDGTHKLIGFRAPGGTVEAAPEGGPILPPAAQHLP